ncbi:MAG: hypothetical protein QXN74_08665 [Saccharolobus sp.]
MKDFLQFYRRKNSILNYKDERQQLLELVEIAKNESVAILDHGDPSVSDWQFIEKIRNMAADRGLRWK